METVKLLKKIRDICKGVDTCHDCILKGVTCDITPEYWTDEEIETMAEVINNHEEEE